MLTYLEARDKIRSVAKQLPTEHVPLAQSLNRILAHPIFADRDYPPFNRAAMDGIAIRIDDWNNGIREFRIRNTIFAGMETSTVLANGECYKIMTGAACPREADTIIRKEDLIYTPNETALILGKSISHGHHLAQRGEDLKQNELAVTAPRVCDISVIGTLAALGIHQVPVYKMPRVGIVTTGNEVVDIDQQPEHFQIRNSNQYLLCALCEQWQLPVQFCQHVSDEPLALSAVLRQAMEQQLILINGGVSAGDADYVPRILQELGVEILFHKVSIKPGKPLLMGLLPQGRILFALPGNPLSCFMTFKLFVEEYLHKCLGFTNERFQQVKLQTPRSKKSSLDEFFPVFRQAEAHRYTWKPHHGSGDITATVGCEGIGWHIHNKQVITENDTIPVLSLHPFFNLI
ncbi:molybdopterin molybdotransferase MoeA [Sphingobacterium sp. SGR-19]|uniref:molybdopterin molybdotransferase MoeA n=1 Tax=Sphingobacterium sp. SGR-19 TaxID=2710886 RepID=UPI0013EA4E00|nr:molybdopterin molybdotransferase MoeA [Sphingobacterium sp. SGR-19]NGM66525.1 molybdopterin molybdotransferase MoeA [Sphingobacterium sp. SGR-19]